MLHCKQCQAPIEEDFGLVTCKSCGASFFVEEDSELQSEDLPVLETEAVQIHSNDSADDYVEESQDLSNDEYDLALSQNPIEVTEEQSREEEEFVVEEEASHEPFETSEEGADGAFMERVFFEEDVEKTNAKLSDIVDYGNSELSQASEGPLLVYIKIGDVDTKEDKLVLYDYLNDPKFGWDAHQIIKTEVNGIVSIDKVSALKAAILIQQLVTEKFKITWELRGVVES